MTRWILVPAEPAMEQILTQGRSRPDLAKDQRTADMANALNIEVRRAAAQIYREMVAAAPLNPTELASIPPTHPEDYDYVALLMTHDRRRTKWIVVPPGQSLDLDADGERKWLKPHLGDEWHLQGFAQILHGTSYPENGEVK